MRFFSHQKGYTLIELMIVIGIIAILSTVSFLNLVGYEARRDLESTTKRIAALFRDAQSRSVTQEGGKAWGVFIDDAVLPAKFQLFQRDVGCAFTSQASVVLLSSRFASPTLVPIGYAKTICFEPVTGFLTTAAVPEPATINIDLASGGGTPRTIKIYNNGRIE